MCLSDSHDAPRRPPIAIGGVTRKALERTNSYCRRASSSSGGTGAYCYGTTARHHISWRGACHWLSAFLKLRGVRSLPPFPTPTRLCKPAPGARNSPMGNMCGSGSGSIDLGGDATTPFGRTDDDSKDVLEWNESASSNREHSGSGEGSLRRTRLSTFDEATMDTIRCVALGESGVGKTALLLSFLRNARRCPLASARVPLHSPICEAESTHWQRALQMTERAYHARGAGCAQVFYAVPNDMPAEVREVETELK